MLLSAHPGVPIEQVKGSAGFELIIPYEVEEAEPPAEEELKVLGEIDPAGIVLGRAKRDR